MVLPQVFDELAVPIPITSHHLWKFASLQGMEGRAGIREVGTGNSGLYVVGDIGRLLELIN